MESKGEDAAQYSTGDSVQRYPVVKPTKSNKRDAISPGSHHDARLELLDPDKLRRVAGGVTRRTDRVERAEPPPSSPRFTAGVERERPRRRRQGGAGFGSDSDSDSDDDKPKRNRDNDDPKPISRRKLPESQPQDLPDLPTSKVLPISKADVEEQERLQQLRDLRIAKENWAAIDERRGYFHKERQGREKQLRDATQRMSSRPREIPWFVLDRDARLREYLDENLYGAIDKVPDERTKIQVEQVFCPDIIQRGEVSLVLVKGNHPSTVKNVSAKDLERLGWFHETVHGQRRYWRCEPSKIDSRGLARNIFKVGMDGEILGAYCRNGRSWAFWEYGEPQPPPRPLNAAETKALGFPSIFGSLSF
ncbi:hypothetical protein DL769_000238 [Monosporascus sp. CRB-8-3]|nr:hypothetical protein DL769_000238 [Monosporascus sp. CRB-8-3]